MVDTNFALQPWRVRQRKAFVTTAAFTMRDHNSKVISTKGTILQQGDEVDYDRTRDQLAAVLRMAIAGNYRVVGWNMTFDLAWLIAYDLWDLVVQLEWLDAMRLWMHLYRIPTFAGSLSYALGEANKKFEKAYAAYKAEGASLYHDPRPEARKRLLAYNKDDTEATLLHAERFWPQLTERQQKCALIEASCLPYVARANVTGMRIDMEAREVLSNTLRDVGHRIAAIMAPLDVTEAIVRSPARMATLLFKRWELPVYKYNDPTPAALKKQAETGVAPILKPSTDKEVLYEMGLEDERVHNLQLWREALNLNSKFMGGFKKSTEYNEEGNKSYPQAVVYSTYCVPGDVEVMTRTGWVPLQDWNGGDIVQVWPDQTMEFLPATRFTGPMVDRWVQLKHKSFEGCFTHGHTMPYLAQKTGAWRTKLAGEFFEGETRDIPRAGILDIEGSLTPDQMRFLVAFQADGSQRRFGITFTFKKARKIERMRVLLNRLGIKHREYFWRGQAEFHISKRNQPDWTIRRKVFGPWLLDTTQAGLAAFIAEIEHWDGSPHEDGGTTYSSIDKTNVDWIVTIAALTGRKATAHAQQGVMFPCHISEERAVTSIRPAHVSEVEFSGRAYCATTATGFWLARSRGHVFITGNTSRMTYSSKLTRAEKSPQIGFALHQMKRDIRFRNCVQAIDDDHVLVEFDAASQEFKWMAILSGDPVMLNLCRPGEDPHSYMTAQIYNLDYKETVVKNKAGDKTVGGQRKLGKVANLSLQYRTSRKRLRVAARVDYGLKMDEDLAGHVWLTYRKTYVGVPKYWRSQIQLGKELGYAETLAGRRVYVDGDWTGELQWAMESTMINYPIQGTGGEQKYLAIRCLRNMMAKYDAKFAWDLHDGLYFYVPKAKAEKFLVEARFVLDNLPYRQAWGFTPPVPLTWDAKIGPTWGQLKDYHG